MRSIRLGLLAGLAVAALLPSTGSVAAGAAKTVWLCRPGQARNPCVGNLDTTVLSSLSSADGSRIERARNATRAPIDCFYVYPTVSDQNTANATLHVDPEERSVAAYQASRFSQVCRVWAPMYRQLTLAGILDPSKITPAATAKAYAAVLTAWREYLATDNHGRGFVLIGHSQGSFVLRKLLADEIDRKPRVRRRLVSALLAGGNVTVRKGQDVGGDFRHVRACHAASQIGCVVAYSMFNDTPPADSRFGRVTGAAASRLQVLCTNPAALGGGAGRLRAYSLTEPFHGTIGAVTNAFLGPVPTVSTRWISPPGRYIARCSSAAGASVLQVDAVDGARRFTASPDAGWGLHLGDVNLALGNLTALVRKQAAAYARTHR